MTSIRCPECHAEVEVTASSMKNNSIEFCLGKKDTFDNMILKALHQYWRWKGEGCKPFYGSGFPMNLDWDKTEHQYDDYHSHIKYLPEENAYEFNIQTFDSPEGDEWVEGKFKYMAWTEGPDRHVETILVLEKKTHC